MPKPVKFQEMVGSVRRSLEKVPVHRRGRNIRYKIADAGLAAFSVFCMQSPSFLAYQRQMEEQRAENNARSLFGVEMIPSDGQIRSLLDPVEPSYLRAPFWAVYELLQARGHLEAYEGVAGRCCAHWMGLNTSPHRRSNAPTARFVCTTSRSTTRIWYWLPCW